MSRLGDSLAKINPKNITTDAETAWRESTRLNDALQHFAKGFPGRQDTCHKCSNVHALLVLPKQIVSVLIQVQRAWGEAG
eukprot:scaffold324372_cov19-Prasinocladus_malaysianus.AAC.1